MAEDTTSEDVIAMAGRTVSETYELLENILLRLPMLEILKAKVVSQHWKALIERSKPLKKALYLVCEPGECIQMSTAAIDADEWLPVFHTASIDTVPIFTKLCLDGFQDREPWRTGVVATESFLRLINTPPVTQYCFRWTHEQATRATRYPWCSMYLTSPPVTTLHIELWSDPMEDYGVSEVVLRDMAGIKLGLMGETALKLARLYVTAKPELRVLECSFNIVKRG
ncbi:hypothetical protein LTR08_001661 [Meristemomyces frigidus]|nr:hypothetical protein LTR08_001661 [Meristemomyces frigidus]